MNIVKDKTFISEFVSSYMEHCIVHYQLLYNIDRKESILYLKALYLEIVKYIRKNIEHKCPIILYMISIYKQHIELILKGEYRSNNISGEIKASDIEEGLLSFMDLFIHYLDKELEHLEGEVEL